MSRRNLYKILFLICFWIGCTTFIITYDASGSGFRYGIKGDNSYNIGRILIIASVITFIGATILGTFEVLFLNAFFRKKPFGYLLIAKTLIYLCFIITFISLFAFLDIAAQMGKSVWSKEVQENYIKYISSFRFIMDAIYWGLACFLALFMLQVDEKFGQGVLYNFLRGKYHRPKEENRIFMFMDLKSSTTHAEQLGHIRYSQFIQDCFWDLTEMVTRFQAEIYQYVGDEVVLSWKKEKGVHNGNCIRAFFAYNDILQNRKAYYLHRYDMVPEFKAGVNIGRVTVAEVGEIKKELAYHGDTINTAARIQDQCNLYQKKLLISEQLKVSIRDRIPIRFDYMGDILLKGKEKSVKIYAVDNIS